MTESIAVIGGGLSGLITAYQLVRERAYEVVLLEATHRLGGHVATEVLDGVTLEGGLSVLPFDATTAQLLDNLHLRASVGEESGVEIFHRGHHFVVPSGIQGGVPTRLNRLWGTELLSLGEKLRVGSDFFLPRQMIGDDISVGALLRHRLGPGYVSRIAVPLLARWWAGPIDELSVAVTSPYLLQWQAREASLIRASQQDGLSHLMPRYARLEGGMSSLVTSLQATIEPQVSVRLGAKVTRIEPMASGGFRLRWDQGTLDVSSVVLCIPAYQAYDLLTFWPSSAREHLAMLPYQDVTVVGAVFDANGLAQPSTRGFMVPRGEAVEMLGGTWHRGDNPDLVGLRTVYGNVADPSAEAMTAQFRREVGYTAGLTDPPQAIRIFHWGKARPQYRVGHVSHVRALEEEEKRWPGLYLMGDYLYRGDMSGIMQRASWVFQTLGHKRSGQVS